MKNARKPFINLPHVLERLIFLLMLMIGFSVSISAQVTVTGSTDANGSYTQLNLAFSAINLAGAQTGNNITVEISASTTETASAVLNAKDWTSLTVRPTNSVVVSGTIPGAVVNLNGADNVTIDGRIAGSGRNLTILNNSTATGTAAIWLSSGTMAGSGATNNIIRNLELQAGATQNISTAATFGIIMSGGAISTTSAGVDNDNNSFIANRIIRARYGIATRGVNTNNNLSPIIRDNIIGPTSFGDDEIGKAGIYMLGDDGAIVTGNTIQFVGGDIANTTTGTDRCGICIGDESWTTPNSSVFTSGAYSVTKNIIHDVVEERGSSAMGLRLGTTRGANNPTNNLVANNFIYNIRANATVSDQVVGIAYSGGHTDRIVFNSISITGDQDPNTSVDSTNFGNAMRISAANSTSHTNLTMANNSIYMDVNSDLATTHFYAITAPSFAYSFGTGFLNYNNYYVNQMNTQMFTGGLSTIAGATATTEFQTLANWQTAFTVPQDANSIQTDPLYVSNTSDLHLQAGSPNINAAIAVTGVNDDIDAQTRPQGSAPDMGADEVVPSAAGVSLGGRIITANGQGIRNAVITVEGGNLPEPMVAISSSFGYYRFDDLPAGLSYVVTVGTKRYTFANPSRLVNLDDAMTDVDFVAEPMK